MFNDAKIYIILIKAKCFLIFFLSSMTELSYIVIHLWSSMHISEASMIWCSRWNPIKSWLWRSMSPRRWKRSVISSKISMTIIIMRIIIIIIIIIVYHSSISIMWLSVCYNYIVFYAGHNSVITHCITR